MAKKRRKRSAERQLPKSPAPPVDRIARVRASDATWAQFRLACGDTPITLALGRLVELEVARHQARRAREGSLDDEELRDALEYGRELQDGLDAIVERIETRLDWDASKRGLVSKPTPTLVTDDDHR